MYALLFFFWLKISASDLRISRFRMIVLHVFQVSLVRCIIGSDNGIPQRSVAGMLVTILIWVTVLVSDLHVRLYGATPN